MPREYQHYFKPIYFHEGQEDQLLQLAMENSDAIEEEIRLCGYFCIVTSRKMTAKEALELYKSRDESENCLRVIKPILETERSAFKRTKPQMPRYLSSLLH